MKSATVVAGMILVLLGIIGLFAGSLIFGHKSTERGLGPLRLEHQETRTLPIPPVLGGIALVAGIVLVVAGSRKA
jgi:hypothetical protein